LNKSYFLIRYRIHNYTYT